MRASSESTHARREAYACYAAEWWELEQRLNDLLGLDPYGDEPDDRWGGARSKLREAVLRMDRNPEVIARWLERGGCRLIRPLRSGPDSLSHATLDAQPQTPEIARLRTHLRELGALPPTEEELAQQQREVVALLARPYVEQKEGGQA